MGHDTAIYTRDDRDGVLCHFVLRAKGAVPVQLLNRGFRLDLLSDFLWMRMQNGNRFPACHFFPYHHFPFFCGKAKKPGNAISYDQHIYACARLRDLLYVLLFYYERYGRFRRKGDGNLSDCRGDCGGDHFWIFDSAEGISIERRLIKHKKFNTCKLIKHSEKIIKKTTAYP